MPRPKKEAGAEPKKRSRTGCWPCKARKVKCGEEKPVCANCTKSGEACDYSIRLNWGGRSRKDKDGTPSDAGSFTFVTTPISAAAAPAKSNGAGHDHVFSAQHIVSGPQRPPSSHPIDLPTPEPTPGGGEGTYIDPRLRLAQQQQQQVPNREHQPSPHAPTYLPPIGSARGSPTLTERTSPTSAPMRDEFSWSPQHRAKRVKLNSPPTAQPSPVFAVPQYPGAVESPSSTHFTPHSISSIVNTPATPGSSINSGSPYPPQPAALNVQDPPDLRRLSVKSLLSDPAEENDRPRYPRADSQQGHRTYGYDHGFPDLDVPHNDDNNVVLPKSPDLRRASAAVSEVSTSSGEIDAKQIAFEPGGYYAQPVAIRIPRALEPLPPELLENQMNLLYFHHFINHTGRIMVPHDCPENPFRGVLPQMAVRNQHLLHLLLAFSASHRARLLDHAEPANRIAGWMSDVLPALRQALGEPSSPGSTDPTDPSSLAPLATAIMLASLEIVSPHTFSVRIPWQQHLQVARQMIVAKGGLHHLAQKSDGARDKAIFFLSRWFAYLDVLGSLSNRYEQPLFGAYLEDGGGLWLVNRDNEEIYQIDCFFGFSGRCIALLAQVAELAAQCDNQRIDPVTNQVKMGWRPPEYFRQQAEELKKRLNASANTVYRGCMHTDPNDPQATGSRAGKEAEEIYATNEAYHWAGLIHLSRRVLALSSTSPEVQDSVNKVISSLQKVRRGSTAESCLLFPMFTAGCEAQREDQRQLFMDRLKAVEGWGMSHVGRARALMQTVWDTGRPWETLVDGEFFG
ncbi:hypothetical protein M409DRAFT_71286 [Zasmidium cellare ATCC 36951]|uniref:Zn(2)-C6 fungal-type domain-containing protein n=1 Tax=Zasmidium cellare ATCC 36951 TaxID=1080233 RepID=A0A6A6BW72_ZASCE|nr:uncharacterized protein M409DRAFT_71286 [Zasmidium cellare ATCC 36951]KAF2159037.1 hypothetical protein M409DRAFT_71286 [Zasmidium cellare ATCC 36951]